MDQTTIGVARIMEMTPFRAPFMMIDRVAISEDRMSGKAIKVVSAGEAFFSGHFPEQAIMPGVLQVEAIVPASPMPFTPSG